jgi:Fanconi anemia group M protein
MEKVNPTVGPAKGGKNQKTLVGYLSKGSRAEPVGLVVDYRERASLLVAELARLGVAMDFKSLKVGDYLVSEEIAIERKTLEDFAGSILDRRLFEQARALREAYPRPLLLLEGRGPLRSGISQEALRGAMTSVMMDMGVPMLWVNDAAEGALFILTICRREQRGERRDFSLKDRRRALTPEGEREYVVASLPFVEAKMAKRLLSTFRSVQGVFCASEKELMEVEGIGPKKAKRIRELVGGEYTVKASSDGPSPECPEGKRGT